MTPAQIRIKAKSLSNGANSDRANKFLIAKLRIIYYHILHPIINFALKAVFMKRN